MTHVQATILRIAEVEASAVAPRANIFEMSQTAEQAVLRPKDCGGFSHELRAALAARVARAAGDDALAAYYLADAGDQAELAEPGEGEMAHILGFVDKVANRTREIEAADIQALQTAGIGDGDIVRLCELVAFLAYQIRVIAGLRLLQGTGP